MDDLTCVTCGSLADGYKCSDCGLEQAKFEGGHLCGVETMIPKCSLCSEVETACGCDIL